MDKKLLQSSLVIAITGPAGSGKSTVATMLSKTIEQCVNIDADYVKHFIVNGFVYGESSEGTKQWQLLGENLGMIARNFQQAGYNVIINGYINEPAWSALTKHIVLTHKLLLLPSLEEIITRDKLRHADFVMGKAVVEEHNRYFSTSSYYDDFEKIDSSKLSAEQTANQILAKLEDNEAL